MTNLGTGDASTEERRVLIAGDELERVDRLAPVMLRASFAVRRSLGAPMAVKLVREGRFDVIVIVQPLASSLELLGAIRAEDSPCRRAAVLLVLAPDPQPGSAAALPPEAEWALSAQANRVLPATCAPEEILSLATGLIQVAPRVPVRASARLFVGAPESEPRIVQVEDLSTTGMLLSAREPLPEAGTFGFEITLRSFSTPIRGQAHVVRQTPGKRPGELAIAATFVSFGGEGAKLLEKVIFQERAASSATQWTRPATGTFSAPRVATGSFSTPRGAPGPTTTTGVIAIRDAEELKDRRAELAELTPHLEALLRKGLEPRVKSAEWYVAAASLGTESLTAMASILEAVQGGRTRTSQVSQPLADLGEVRRYLAEFIQPRQEVARRVRIMLDMRESLERLLRALALTGASGDSGSRPRGLVAEVIHDVHQVLRARQTLRLVPGLMDELEKPMFLVARAAQRKRAEEIAKDLAPWAVELGLTDVERLLTRPGRKETALASNREVRRLDLWVTGIHQRVYAGKFRARATSDLEADLAEAKLAQILMETLSAGAEFLVRAYSAYRHALELTGADPRLLDRVAGLTASVAAADRRAAAAARDEAAPPPNTEPGGTR